MKTWLQQADSDPAKVYDLSYDPVDELTAAVLESTDPTPQILKRYYYAYDAAGNRTGEQIDDDATAATFNNMNEIVTQGPGGPLVFRGTTDKEAMVTVAGQPATQERTGHGYPFSKAASVPSGTSQVTVSAHGLRNPPEHGDERLRGHPDGHEPELHLRRQRQHDQRRHAAPSNGTPRIVCRRLQADRREPSLPTTVSAGGA